MRALPKLSACGYQFHLVVGILTIVTNACASVTTKPADPPFTEQRRSGVDQSPVSTAVPGIPNLPDLVTMVPFESFDEQSGWICFQAELDGRHGIFGLDTGSPMFWLNPHYLRPSATGGIDTVVAGEQLEEGSVTVHTLRVGTLIQHLDTTDVGVPVPFPTNAQLVNNGWDELATFGLPGMEPFETILDYVHRRLVLIRLDKAGRRLAAVPAYTPAYTVPLVPSHKRWWGIEMPLGGTLDTLTIDTGNPHNSLLGTTQKRLGGHVVQSHTDSTVWMVDHLVVAGHSFDAVPFHINGDNGDDLNYPFMRRLGVVGFNLRTRQLVVYR